MTNKQASALPLRPIPLRFLPVIILLVLCSVTLSQQCPDECYCGDGGFVSCSHCTKDTFRSLPKEMKHLVLSDANITSFPRDFFKQFPNLTLLEIQSSQVKIIANGTFSGIGGLEHFAMLDSRVEEIEEGAFSGAGEVSELFILKSSIGTIHTRAFSALRDIKNLSIINSDIKHVERRAFQNVSDFHSFTFKGNTVETLASEAFQDIRNISLVEVSENKGVQDNALQPLVNASEKALVFANSVQCLCHVVREYQRRETLQQLQCIMPGTEQKVNATEVDIKQVCANESVPPSTVSPTYPVSTVSAKYSKSAALPKYAVTTPSEELRTLASPDYGQQTPKSGRQTPDYGQQTPKSGRQTPDYEQQTPNGRQTPNSGRQTPDYEQLTPKSGHHTPDYGQQTPKSGRQTPDYGQQTPKSGRQTPDYGQQTPNRGQEAAGTTLKAGHGQVSSMAGQVPPVFRPLWALTIVWLVVVL